MPPVGFEPTISASELPQTYALDRAATINYLHDLQNSSGAWQGLRCAGSFKIGLLLILYVASDTWNSRVRLG